MLAIRKEACTNTPQNHFGASFEWENYGEFLYFQFKKFTDNNDMDTGSKVRDPKKYAMGDDLCEYLTKVGIPKRALPPNAKKGTENGIQVTASNLYFQLVMVISK